MLLTIDNADGRGAQDYTANLDAEHAPTIQRALNRPSRLTATLVAATPDFIVPAGGARVVLQRGDGTKLFTGYLSCVPDYEYLGWGERGPLYRYTLTALSDEVVLDRKLLSQRAPFTQRTAGAILRQLANDLAPGVFDTAAVEAVDTIPSYAASTGLSFSDHAAALAVLTRASYRATDDKLTFRAIGRSSYTLDESAPDFCPDGLRLHSPDKLVNDVTVTGRTEPAAYVKDYFLGDGVSLGFPLSQTPFGRFNQVIVEDEYTGSALNARNWTAADPARAVSVSGGKLRLSGGTGADGATTVSLCDALEFCGGLVLQHGDVEFTAASTGIIGGLYNSAVDLAHCVAGFRITPSGAQSVITPVINAANAGSTITTQAGHRYLLTTRIYAQQRYRYGQAFHSSQHPSGSGLGGASIADDLRVVLEVHDVDPANNATLAAPAIILYDGTIANAPASITYAIVNSASLRATIAFTRLFRAPNLEVSSTVPGQSSRTKLTGSFAEGAQCYIVDPPELRFYSQYAPVSQEAIRCSYRASRQSVARVIDSASIAANSRAGDDGLRLTGLKLTAPAPRTSAECETVALALLDDTTRTAWAGEYRTWSDFLPQHAVDVFPGDALVVTVPSRNASFTAVVRGVEIELTDPATDRFQYTLKFANDAADPLAWQADTAQVADETVPVQTTTTAGTAFIADLPNAEVTAITSIAITVNAGLALPSGGGIEVRRSDYGWGAENDRNLVGRFTTQTFTLPRLSATQTYYLRQYDASALRRYSRYSTALHIDYPL